uniref:Uncharacterized protein n=1 Tax=Anguilla anguilla TaxID=7936 RepID=A0A0E9SGC7_ANGAN
MQEENLNNHSLMGIDEIQSKSYTEELEASLKERACLIKEKEELIASLEQQLQKEIHLHEVALEKMKVRVNELQQRSTEKQETSKTEEHRDEK